jgi:hypothetical protein
MTALHYAAAAREYGPACNLPQATGGTTSDLAAVTCGGCIRSTPYQVAAGTLTRADIRLPRGSETVHWHPRPGARSACNHVHDPASIAIFEQAGRLTTDRAAVTCEICKRSKGKSRRYGS